ncbi:MAG: response regulator [Sandaracinus sp.]|nr:response regulator [Sandaracinus sp.]MCB9616707.1 response regulator [Sandaracinus sp.]MCB9632505.1 response regulator [Sandaracinus sp.]
MKILVVDDSSAMRKIVLRALRQAGFADYATEEAANGAEALEKHAAFGPDLVLCDWNMPEMNGIELLRELRNRGVATPFAFITSENTEAVREEALSAGALGLVTKPFAPEALRATLGAVFGGVA